jgi:hypothetical protein
MARRFGRNRRRKMREQLAALDQALQMDRELLRYATQELGTARKIINDARRIAGRASILFPAETIEVDHDLHPGDKFRVATFEPFRLQDFGAGAAQAEQIAQTQSLPQLISSINLDKLRQHVHYHVEYADRRVAYAVDERTLYLLPKDLRERGMTETIAAQLAVELLRGLPGAYSR